MKKYISVVLFSCASISLQAQEVFDALRLGQTDINGTARSQAMSGAFGALGGDLSAMGLNPAGSAIFSNNQWGLSLSDNIVKNKTNYYDTRTQSSKNSINLNQAGAVFVFENYDPNSKWNKFSLGLNYEKTGNYENDVFSAGTSKNSIANYFLSYANDFNGVPGIRLGDLQNIRLTNDSYEKATFADQQAALGYQAYIFEPIPFAADPNNYNDPNIQAYSSNVILGGDYKQENSMVTSGGTSKFTFNAAAQYDNWLSIGLNLNSHTTDYKQSTSFLEITTLPLDANYQVNNVRFNNRIHTTGGGFSMQVGAIAKVNKMLRLGLTYESPTWYELTDEISQDLRSVSTKEVAGLPAPLPADVADPKLTKVLDPYSIQTPGKLTVSGALIFAKNGLLSIDASTKDYSNSNFGPSSDFRRVNNQLAKNLTNSVEIKVGGEYRIKQLSLRGGFRTEQSPYKDKKIMSDLVGFSSGLGYTWGDTKLDFAFSQTRRTSQNQFFYQGFTDASTTRAINNNATLTLTFEL